MKIAIVVHGRFHAFDLARALIDRGNDVTVFTNYPRWVVARYGIAKERVQSFPLHGLLLRAARSFELITGVSLESWTHRSFARWAARRLRHDDWDVIHAWTGVAEEIYRDNKLHTRCRLIMRGSAHIHTQAVILAAEAARAGCKIDRPSKWMIARECREYEVADIIVVLSTFAYNSFREEGVADSKIRILQLGAETASFRPDSEVIKARCSRLLSGAPLRVLYVGNISFQKGLADIREIIGAASDRFQFRLVGEVTREAVPSVSALLGKAEFVGKVGHYKLPDQYRWADIFIFPTIQDGYATVLAQASASGLPILTTTNCAGPDLVKEGRTGWILPIRSPQAFLDRLVWCDSHRGELAEIVATAYSEFRTRDWSQVAADFEMLCAAVLGENEAPSGRARFSAKAQM